MSNAAIVIVIPPQNRTIMIPAQDRVIYVQPRK